MVEEPVAPREKKPRGITRENSLAMVERRRQLAAEGKIKLGRPKGVFNKATMAKINSRTAFVEEVTKKAGILANDLMRNSAKGDTKATLGALDRIGISPVQRVKLEGTVGFSLVELALQRPMLDGNPDTRILESGEAGIAEPESLDVSIEE